MKFFYFFWFDSVSGRYVRMNLPHLCSVSDAYLLRQWYSRGLGVSVIMFPSFIDVC